MEPGDESQDLQVASCRPKGNDVSIWIQRQERYAFKGGHLGKRIPQHSVEGECLVPVNQ
jgi:hypothetical protein